MLPRSLRHTEAWLMVFMAIWLTKCLADCPKKCRCTDSQVSCIAQQLVEVPSPIPVTTSKLNLHHNRLRIISTSSLANLPYLLSLDLSSNQIPGLIETAFQSNRLLERLILSSNQLPAVPKAIRHLYNLKYIYLEANRIKSVSASDFRGLFNLQELILLSNPQLSHIHKDAFKDLTGLRKLMIGYCSLQTIDSYLFKNKDLQVVGLYSNPWKCDCRLKWLWYWMSITNTTFVYQYDIKCMTPGLYEGFPVHSLRSGAFKCEGMGGYGNDVFTISTDTTQWGVQDRTRVLAGGGGLTDIHSTEFQEFAVTVCASVAASAVFLVLLGCASVWLRKAWRERKVLTKQKRNDAILFQYIKTQVRRSYLPPYWVHEPPPQYMETAGQTDPATVQVQLHQRSNSQSSDHEAPQIIQLQISSIGESMTADQQQHGDRRVQSNISRTNGSVIVSNPQDSTRQKDYSRSLENVDTESETSDVYVDCSEDFLDETVMHTGLTREESLRQARRILQGRLPGDRGSFSEREAGAGGLTREQSLRHALRNLQRRSQELETSLGDNSEAPQAQPKQLTREESLRRALRSLQQRQRHSFHASSSSDNGNSTPDLHVTTRQGAHLSRSLRHYRGWSYNGVSLDRNSSERPEERGRAQLDGFTGQDNFSQSPQGGPHHSTAEGLGHEMGECSGRSLGDVSAKQSRAAREERLREALRNLQRSSRSAEESCTGQQNHSTQTDNSSHSETPKQDGCQQQPENQTTEKEMVTAL
ncbi:SLIT1 [Branchiostoma lanceolatum]|uniref:SLIT1 protein n=1 Tax=Branchiostoma lanceolatum TaxID=7740 RepID=A0A8J9ZIU4_BRALA|nr:SLIT1 [Branchiostoma lanceolatum]